MDRELKTVETENFNDDIKDAVNKKHEHTNKDTLDTYTQTEANLADAVSKKHSHNNKTLLDSYTQTDTDLADAVSKKHSHNNKTLLDTYTQTDTNLADAVNKKHEHTNKSTLDSITALPLPISQGGTGANSAPQARTNLDVPSKSGTETITGQYNINKLYVNPDGKPIVNLGYPSWAELAIPSEFENKTAFYNINNLIFESYDGSTWTDVSSSISDTNKKRLVGGDLISNVLIPYNTVQYRITFKNPPSYVWVSWLYAYISFQGHASKIHIWAHQTGGDWVQITNSTDLANGWPNHVFLPFANIQWGLNYQYDQVRVNFIPSWNPSYSSYNIRLYKIQLWGGYPVGNRSIFSTDENKNVTFPAKLTGSQLISNANSIRIVSSKTPASASDTGTAGDICWDSNYLYICVATNTWKRVAIGSW